MPDKRSSNDTSTYKQGRSVNNRAAHAKHASGSSSDADRVLVSAELPRVEAADSAPAAKAPAQKTATTKPLGSTSVAPERVTKPSKMPIIIGAAFVVFLIVAIASFTNFNAPAAIDEGSQVRVEIADGSTTRDIADALLDAELIGNKQHFLSTVTDRQVDSQLKPGSYLFTGGMTEDEIIDKLIAGPSSEDGALTIPEGSTLDDVAQAVANAYNGQISKDDFLAVANDAQRFADDFPFVADAYNNSLEGFLFPKTYTYVTNPSAEAVVRQMLEQYQKEVATLDYSYPKNAGLSEYQALVLASIVQRETGGDEEPQGKVASVFYNRLAIDMPLQSDATTAYAIGGDPTPEDLKIEGPYNTYLNKGLPPGPINSPSLEALKAVCSPETTDYLFFYFKEDGSGTMQYYFSETYEEHNQAIAEH